MRAVPVQSHNRVFLNAFGKRIQTAAPVAPAAAAPAAASDPNIIVAQPAAPVAASVPSIQLGQLHRFLSQFQSK